MRVYGYFVVNEWGQRNKTLVEEFKYFVLSWGEKWSWMNMRSTRSQREERPSGSNFHKRDEWRRQIEDAGLRREAKEDVPFEQDIEEHENKIYIKTIRTDTTEMYYEKKWWSTRFAHILFLKRNKSSMNALCLRVFNVLVYILLCSLFL